jgi:hypothetical protein
MRGDELQQGGLATKKQAAGTPPRVYATAPEADPGYPLQMLRESPRHLIGR